MSDVVANDALVAAKEKAEVEPEVAIVAKEFSEVALSAMSAERDAFVTEKKAAVSAKEEVMRNVDESRAPQVDVAQKTAQRRIKELTRANDNLTNSNAAPKGEIVKMRTVCDNFKDLNNRIKSVRQDSGEWEDIHDRQVDPVAA